MAKSFMKSQPKSSQTKELILSCKLDFSCVNGKIRSFCCTHEKNNHEGHQLISDTAKRILERHGIQTLSSFVKISVCIPEFKANFLFLGHFFII